jgi:hypothetical protein
MIHTYGPPCFRDNSSRSISIIEREKGWVMTYRTSYVQGMKEGTGDVDEVILDTFTEYKSKLNKEDKRLFKSYFDSLCKN